MEETFERFNTVHLFETMFARFVGAKHAIAVNSGTAALHTALLASEVGKGAEVITSPFSFIATANAILMTGAEPVFVDIKEDTLTMDPKLVEEKITKKTKAILLVHIFGNICEMPRKIQKIEKGKIAIIEDCAQVNLPYTPKGRYGCFSFYSSKYISTFEGGMITTNYRTSEAKCRMIINHGQDRRYHHVRLGFNYRMSEIAALLGIHQLKYKRFKPVSYGIEQGHYPVPIYEQPLYKKLGYYKKYKGTCPVCEEVCQEISKRWI